MGEWKKVGPHREKRANRRKAIIWEKWADGTIPVEIVDFRNKVSTGTTTKSGRSVYAPMTRLRVFKTAKEALEQAERGLTCDFATDPMWRDSLRFL